VFFVCLKLETFFITFIRLLISLYIELLIIWYLDHSSHIHIRMGCCLSIDDRANKNAYFSDYNDPTISPVNGASEPSDPIMLRDNPDFTCSTNGRNGWLIHEVYDFGELVRIDNFV
jgi:hypothetical protein